jgi:hypothetical protein
MALRVQCQNNLPPKHIYIFPLHFLRMPPLGALVRSRAHGLIFILGDGREGLVLMSPKRRVRAAPPKPTGLCIFCVFLLK